VSRAEAPRDVEGYTHHELFGPDVAFEVVKDTAEAIEHATRSPWGLAASVYCGNREQFEAVATELDVGVVHWNRPSTGASGRLPFGGAGRSGNGRPAGILWGRSSSYPQAILMENPGASEPNWPGFPGPKTE
jgi:succinylglutamic semialdehyde dehydrogenase